MTDKPRYRIVQETSKVNRKSIECQVLKDGRTGRFDRAYNFSPWDSEKLIVWGHERRVRWIWTKKSGCGMYQSRVAAWETLCWSNTQVMRSVWFEKQRHLSKVPVGPRRFVVPHHPSFAMHRLKVVNRQIGPRSAVGDFDAVSLHCENLRLEKE